MPVTESHPPTVPGCPEPLQGLLPEWAPQRALLLVWPDAETDWAADLETVEATYRAIVAAARQPVIIACKDAGHAEWIRQKLGPGSAAASRCRFYPVPYDDTWVRDYGPLAVLGTEGLELVDFRFNAWGDKYPSGRDDAVTRQLHEAGAFGPVPLIRDERVLEGGAIDTDGCGTLLTTESCLLHPSRNRALGKETAEAWLLERLGLERVQWLGAGWLAGDDTDGHVDMLARFADADTICHQTCDDPADPHFEPLRRLAQELAALRKRDGAPYRLVPLPLPAPVNDDKQRRLPCSYANFVILNRDLLVPVYGDPADRVACERLAACFGGRRLVPIDARPLIRQNGSLHCVTMQIPAEPLPPAFDTR